MNVRHLVSGILLALFGTLALPASAIRNYDVSVTFALPSGGNTINSTSGVSNLQFFPLGGSSLFCQNDGVSALPLIRLQAYDGGERTVRQTFNGSYAVSAKIIDDDNPGEATLTFGGTVTGYMSQGEANLVNTFTEPRTKSVALNGTMFTVTIGPFVSPAAPLSSIDGMIEASITCAPTGTGVSNITLPAGTVKSGQAVQGTVTLNGPAPRGGAAVTLTSGTPTALALPASVIIPEGATSAAFIGAAQAAGTNIPAQAHWNGTVSSKTLTIGAGGTCGDTNGDGVVTMVDVVRWLRAVAGLDVMPSC